MLHVFRSNKIEALVALLAQGVSEPTCMPADPFTPLRVVVGSKGMERWLRHQLAVTGPGRICANVEFPFPAQVLHQALVTLEARLGLPSQDTEGWAPDLLAWAILDLLPDLLSDPDDPVVAPLRAYLAGSGPVASAAELSLAQQLASVFARYVATRPQLAVDWSRGRAMLPASLRGALAWQPMLWAALQARLAPARHSAERWDAVLAAAAGHAGGPVFDQPLRVFGVSNLPPPFLHRLSWLAQHDRVELYVLAPSDRYWADLASLPRHAHQALRDSDRDALPQQLQEQLAGTAAAGAHPLLRSLGRVGRDLQIVLQSLEAGYEDTLFVHTEASAVAGEPRPLSAPRVLWRLQADLRELVDPGALSPEQRAGRAPDPADDSLQLHACYGPMRQVQALRDALLRLFERYPDLEPRDVLVMTPDLEGYVPLVGAVFEQGLSSPLTGAPPAGQGPWGAAGAPAIPYQVAERSLRRTNPVAEVLLRCLELAAPGARLSATAVLDLLALEPFRQRFGIGVDDLEPIRGWIRDSGIRWAIDAQDRAEHGQPPLAQNTWRQGLERLALGVAMADDPDRPLPHLADHGPLLPFDAVEGGIVVLLGRFFDAVTGLLQQLDLLRQPRSAAAWISLLLGDPDAPAGSHRHQGSLAALTATTADSAWLEAGVRGTLLELQDQIAGAQAQRAITVQALSAALLGRFELVSGASRVQTGAVTFSAMVPYRSVPYRVICLLGMDEGAFPSSPSRLHFDLTHRQPRVGDRDPRDEDRHLLLEALLSARDHLLVFYTGRDQHSNERRPPAVPVGELCEVLDLSFPEVQGQAPSGWLTRSHPLQAFGPANFQPGQPWSYDPRLLAGARLSLEAQRQPPRFFSGGEPGAPALAPEPVELHDLVRFFRNPVRALLAGGLNLHLWDDAELLQDREPVDPSQVDVSSLAAQLLEGRLAAQRARLEGRPVPPEALALQRIQAAGALPLGSAGQQALAAPRGMATAVTRALEPWLGATGAPIAPLPGEAFSLELPSGGELRGRLPALQAGDLLACSFFDEGPWNIIEVWIQQLAWLAVKPDPVGQSVLALGPRDPSAEASLVGFGFLRGASPSERQAAARGQLAWMEQLYRQGQQRRIPMLARCSHKLGYFLRPGQRGRYAYRSLELRALAGEPPFDEPITALLVEACEALRWLWVNKEGTKPHEQLAYGSQPPFEDPQGPGGLSLDFLRTALRFWEPAMAGRGTRPTPTVPWGGEA
jgi:exodeoxyribonuclease V gamma subunit